MPARRMKDNMGKADMKADLEDSFTFNTTRPEHGVANTVEMRKERNNTKGAESGNPANGAFRKSTINATGMNIMPKMRWVKDKGIPRSGNNRNM